MKALRYLGRGEVALMDVPCPTAGAGQVLLRVAAAGICHSDVHVVSGASSLTQLEDQAPFTLGHEIAGEVVEVGPDVADDLVGARVVVYAPTGCLACAACLDGAWNYCDRRDATSVAGLGLGEDGGLAEYVAVDARRIVPISDLPYDVAAVLTDAALTSLHAASMVPGGVAEGAAVVVIGVGGLGHLAVQILAHEGHLVIGVDTREGVRALATESGARSFCSPGQLADVVAEHTGSRGASAVIDFVGSTQTLELGEGVLGTRGAMIVVGSAGGRLAVDKSRTGVSRGVSYHIPVWGTLPELQTVVDLAHHGALRPTVTQMSLARAPDALEALRRGQVTGRLVVTDFDSGGLEMQTRATSGDLAEVYARYSFGVDHQLAEVIVSCFAADGSIAADGGQPTTGARAISTRLVAVADPAVVHHAFNIVVLDENEGEVVARADFTMSRAGSVIASGHYDDSLTWVAATGWVFRRRSVTYTWRASSD